MSYTQTINISPCDAKNYRLIKLEEPPSCSSGRSLEYNKKTKSFKGPFKNLSMNIVPASTIKKTPKNILRALSKQTIPDHWSWFSIGGNKIEKGDRNQENCGSCWISWIF